MSAPKRLLTPAEAEALVWYQWRQRDGFVRAHALDPSSTRVRRSFAGGMIPEDAVTAVSDTPRDPYCSRIVNRLVDNWRQRHESIPAHFTYSGPESKMRAAVRLFARWLAENRAEATTHGGGYTLRIDEAGELRITENVFSQVLLRKSL